MVLEITINCDNDAFGETPIEHGAEIARILRKLAKDCEEAGPPYSTHILRDINGNTVGSAGLAE